MGQLAIVFISFLFIPILIRMKIKLSYAILISVGILALLSGLGIVVLSNVIIGVFRDYSSLDTILTVMMVSILGGLMAHYGILDKIVEGVLSIVHSKKNALVIIPAIIGILIIPGGALLSAPFVYTIGEDMGIPKVRRAAINLVFRHIAMLLLPFSTSLLIVTATLPNINIYKLILLNFVFVISFIIMGYAFFLKDIKTEESNERKNVKTNVFKLIIFTSPIYVAVIINGLTGLPFFITLIVSVFIVYFLCDKKDFFKVLFKSLSWSTAIMVAAVLIMKDIILNMEDLIGLFNDLFVKSSGFSIMGVFLISALFFGYITGNTTAPLAITLTMLSRLSLGGWEFYLYIYFIFGASFVGYYFSPLHLCQAFTIDYMGVNTASLYKEYRYYAPILFVILIISTFVFRILFI